MPRRLFDARHREQRQDVAAAGKRGGKKENGETGEREHQKMPAFCTRIGFLLLLVLLLVHFVLPCYVPRR